MGSGGWPRASQVGSGHHEDDGVWPAGQFVIQPHVATVAGFDALCVVGDEVAALANSTTPAPSTKAIVMAAATPAIVRPRCSWRGVGVVVGCCDMDPPMEVVLPFRMLALRHRS